MEKDVFKFEDFLSGSKLDELKKMKSELLKEGLFNDDEINNNSDLDFSDDEIIQEFNPYNVNMEKDTTNDDINNVEFDENDDIENIETDESNIEYNSDESYVLYKDKAEDFVCDIAVEGVSQKDTEVRLIVESTDWTLMFKGEIRNGKCIIPLKKLAILNEGQRGNIKLEVNADGNLFTPWEDEFIVKVSKKVTVSLNENKKDKKSKNKNSDIKVNVNKKRP
jgi:hypothetical protein